MRRVRMSGAVSRRLTRDNMDDAHSPEEELVSRAVTGDEDALTTLLRRHAPALRRKIAPAIGAKWRNVLDADDVLQVTYLEVFLRVQNFVPRGPSSFAAWLGRIAQNNLRDAIRELERLKRPHPDRRVEAAGGEESAFQLLEQLGCTTSTASRHAARDEVRLAVETALQNLPEDYASVVRQYDLEDRSAAEVAQAMGRSTGAVYMLRARAHDRLRESFGPESHFFSQTS